MNGKIITMVAMALILVALPMTASAKTIPEGYGCEMNRDFLCVGNTVCGCEAKLISIYPNKNKVAPGETVFITATYELTAGACDACTFLMEASIQSRLQTLATTVSASSSLCCPENDNYAATRVSINNAGGLNPKTEQVTVNYALKAPSVNSIDHCSDTFKSYWKGEGYYDIVTGVYNGCGRDIGVNLVVMLWARQGTIYIEIPDSCGNGICETQLGENPTTCPRDCVDTCGIPGCQEPNDPIYCPDQCRNDYVCSADNCLAPLMMCQGNACVPNYAVISSVAVVIALIFIGTYYVYRRRK